jgi:hypothetical protein
MSSNSAPLLFDTIPIPIPILLCPPFSFPSPLLFPETPSRSSQERSSCSNSSIIRRRSARRGVIIPLRDRLCSRESGDTGGRFLPLAFLTSVGAAGGGGDGGVGTLGSDGEGIETIKANVIPRYRSHHPSQVLKTVLLISTP